MSARITKSQAKTELDRRALPKGDTARMVYPPAHVMQASGAALATIAGVPAPERTKTARKAKAPKANRPAALRLPDGRLVSAAATAEWKAGLGTYTERKALLTAEALGEAQADAKASVTTLEDLTRADALALLRTLLAN